MRLFHIAGHLATLHEAHAIRQKRRKVLLAGGATPPWTVPSKIIMDSAKSEKLLRTALRIVRHTDYAQECWSKVNDEAELAGVDPPVSERMPLQLDDIERLLQGLKVDIAEATKAVSV
eukprot:TRINITY_DN5617_c0_g1_i3.p4 TRINITY_DN5617_c0_g1~~TRINITY_DN5617_c0_g1_i3.p4  ORF type:complete len:118 (+),score=28.77 TRINITY_DN5617_c0_g1_i3:255-608(+)